MTLDPASYLAALIDGEGTIGCYKTKTGHASRVGICNTDQDIIQAAKSCFDSLNIPWSEYITKTTGKARHDIYVRGGFNSFKLVSELIPIQCSRKREILQKILSSRKWKVMPDKKWFEDHYYEKKLSLSEIAGLLDCAPMTVYNWLRRHKIARRPLSLAAKIDWERRSLRRR